MKILNTVNVFGVSNELIETYIERDSVDNEFLRALLLKKHIIVFGSSKQGKSFLILKHLPSNTIKVECSPSSSIVDIYSSILRQIGVEILNSTSEQINTEVGVEVSSKFKLNIPIISQLGISGKAKGQKLKGTTKEYKTLEYNIGLAQDVSEIIRILKFNEYIVLENFHYLQDEVQNKLAFDLRIFQDMNINFVILGIWRERNHLTQFNGDLQDRIIEIPVEPWNPDDFRKIISKGEELLNIDFGNNISKIIDASFDSVGVLQELCKEACFDAKVYSPSKTSTIQITEDHISNSIMKKLGDYSSRHIRSLESFCTLSKTKEKDGVLPLFIPFYFCKMLLSIKFDDIYSGITRSKIHDEIQSMHHRSEDVRSSDMSNFLHNITSYQIKRRIIPPLFDYDRSSRILKIIDSTLYFFLRYCDRNVILDELPVPTDKLDEDCCPSDN